MPIRWAVSGSISSQGKSHWVIKVYDSGVERQKKKTKYIWNILTVTIIKMQQFVIILKESNMVRKNKETLMLLPMALLH